MAGDTKSSSAHQSSSRCPGESRTMSSQSAVDSGNVLDVWAAVPIAAVEALAGDTKSRNAHWSSSRGLVESRTTSSQSVGDLGEAIVAKVAVIEATAGGGAKSSTP